ncbi:MAG: glycosyltransferase, partial [Acidobacteriota bacterium]
VVPPFIAPYFFLDEDSRKTARQRRILMFPKAGYREAGFLDYEIVRKLLQRACLRNPPWKFMEVVGTPHREVASLMQDSEFLVSVNCVEAFNTTVPEAMAAGCLPICYEGFGGQDFLTDTVNAFVFQNNHVYRLFETVERLLQGFSRETQKLTAMRAKAYQTAAGYQESSTQRELLAFFGSFFADRPHR